MAGVEAIGYVVEAWHDGSEVMGFAGDGHVNKVIGEDRGVTEAREDVAGEEVPVCG